MTGTRAPSGWVRCGDVEPGMTVYSSHHDREVTITGVRQEGSTVFMEFAGGFVCRGEGVHLPVRKSALREAPDAR